MAAGHDMTPHVRTWTSYTRMLKWGTAAVAVTLALMALFLL